MRTLLVFSPKWIWPKYGGDKVICKIKILISCAVVGFSDDDDDGNRQGRATTLRTAKKLMCVLFPDIEWILCIADKFNKLTNK